MSDNNVFYRTGGGVDSSDATATSSDILSGKTAYVNDEKITGTIPTKSAATITPSTSNQTIASGQYLSGTQTIKGDSNLISSNIKSGVSIFGVSGSLESGTKITVTDSTTLNSIYSALGSTRYDNTCNQQWVSSSYSYWYFSYSLVFNNCLYLFSENYYYKLGISSNNTFNFIGRYTTPFEKMSQPVVYNNEIHLFGGYTYNSNNSTKYTNNKYHYKSSNGINWTSVGTLPYNASYYNAVVYNNAIHLMGGFYYDNNTYENYLTYHYKYDGTNWTSVGTYPNSANGRVIVSNNKIHSFSGTSGSTYSDVRVKHYEYNGNSWTTKNNLTIVTDYIYTGDSVYNQSFSPGLVIDFNGKLLIIGGSYYISNTRDTYYIFQYDETNDKFIKTSWLKDTSNYAAENSSCPIVYNNTLFTFYNDGSTLSIFQMLKFNDLNLYASLK